MPILARLRALVRRRWGTSPLERTAAPSRSGEAAADAGVQESDRSDFNPLPHSERLLEVLLKGDQRLLFPRIFELPEHERAAARDEAIASLKQHHPGIRTWAELVRAAHDYEATKYPRA